MDTFETAKINKSAADSIRNNKEVILRAWQQKLKNEIIAAGAISTPALLDEIPEFLDRLILCLETSHEVDSGREVKRKHGTERAIVGNYSIESILHEYFLLKKTILEVIKGDTALAEEDAEFITDFIQIATSAAAKKYSEIQTTNIRLNEERLKFAAELAGIGVFEYDCKTKSMWRTKTNDKVFEFDSFGRAWNFETFLSLLHPADRSKVSDALEHNENSTEVWKLQYRIVSPKGEIKWIESTARSLKGRDGEPFKIVGTSVEITDKKKSQDEQSRYAAMAFIDLENLKAEKEVRDKFVSTLTHDLKTPLTAGRVAAQIILRSLNEKSVIERAAEKVIESIDRTDRMINDLLDANRIRAGQKLPIRVGPLNLRKLLTVTLKELILVHGERFVLNCSDDIQGVWDGDGLRRVIENLAYNAIKYGFEDSPITIYVKTFDDKIQIIVHNFGEPISVAEQKTLFDQFRRTRVAENSDQKGWGIGLTLVRGLVEAHGGQVSVESKKETGTRFILVLPKAM
jgi:signal transduction histidine kinase